MPRTIVNIPDAQLHDLDAMCASLGISRAEAVRRAIIRFLRDGCESDDGFGLWREKYAKANEYYKKVLQINPGYTQAINELAWNYVEHGGNLDEALSLAHKAREQAVDRTQITDTLGWIYYKKKAYVQAISLLKESAAAMANNPIARYHLGMAYYKNGNKDLARAELQQALKLDSDFRGAMEAREVLTMLE